MNGEIAAAIDRALDLFSDYGLIECAIPGRDCVYCGERFQNAYGALLLAWQKADEDGV